MINLIDLLRYEFFSSALLASLLASIACGIIGTYIVAKRIVFISGGITHASFGGIGLGYYLGINPIIGAAVFGVLSAMGIEYFSSKGRIREDSVIAILWSFGMAIGIIFVFITPGYAPNLMSYLFGSILTVSPLDLMLLAVLSVLIILLFAVWYYPILFIAFDEGYASTRNIPVKLIKYILLGLVALTVVFSIRVAGIILVISLLTLPPSAANLVTKRFHTIIILSVVIGFAGSVCGLLLSYYLNIPSGASVIFSLVIIFIIIRIARQLHKGRRVKKYLSK